MDNVVFIHHSIHSTIIAYMGISILTFISLVATLIYLVWNLPSSEASSSESKDASDQIKFILTTSKAAVPVRGTKFSAGYDLKSSEACVIPARSRKAVKTGVKVVLPHNTYGRIASRSGLSFKNGLEVGAGVIDEDYRNELIVILHNHSDIDFRVDENFRIAQLIIERVVYPETFIENIDGVISVSSENIRTIRGEGGFGSTGI